jgi:FkbH-like protein
MKYSEILAENSRLEKEMKGTPVKIRVLSNIITNQLKDILEFSLRTEGVYAALEFDNYDNIIQDSAKKTEAKISLIFWELANLTDGLEYKAQLMDNESIEGLIERLKNEIQLCLTNLKDQSLVLFNLFSSMHFNAMLVEENNFDYLAEQLNAFLKSSCPKNVCYVNLDKILIRTGLEASIDLRNYYSSKALYTVDFFRNYANHIKYLILPLLGKVNKALIFDCDNTLWKGILGEDGFDGIRMSGKSAKGKPFEAVQFMAAKLATEGVLIGLCSKNNAEDVEEVLEKHKDQILKNEYITISRVNWSDKAGNLRDMAEILNIGMDSFIFIDDSDFELGLIKHEFPMIKTLQVNTKNHLYPAEFAEVINRFYKHSRTSEDKKKVRMYKEQALRESSRDAFVDIKDYLNSLEIEMKIFKNNEELIPRMAQLTQKTNQFNLTTIRYSETDIRDFVFSDSAHVYALSVRDKYGDCGVTGMAIVIERNGKSVIDSFLLSCRIIGRAIEDEFISRIVADINTELIEAVYIESKKNAQVADLYDRYGFELEHSEIGKKQYKLYKAHFIKPSIKHIKVLHGRET